MKFCILIPCYNHPQTIAAVARDAQKFAPVIVVDDGSTLPLPELPDCEIIRLQKNFGKGTALRAGFARALELGYTHAITMDADGQHFAEDLPKFLDAANSQPTALIVGVRNFRAAGAPGHRQCSNAVSSFWFWAETGVRLRDTQCGFRCYPLALAKSLWTKSGRYAFELEFMVRAAWVGTPIVAVPVKCTYAPHQIRCSHFRPVVDLARITTMNIGLVLQSWFVPRSLRTEWSFGLKTSRKHTLHEIFSEHAHEPLRLALAVGLGLFFGIVPLWGIQMATVAVVAHRLRLNKAIALVASNISIPPVAPFILGFGLILGHWMFTGERLSFPPPIPNTHRAFEYVLQLIIGSVVLGVLVAVPGTIVAYVAAKLFRRRKTA
jgi:uncharacterized protein (DUF2062 family)